MSQSPAHHARSAVDDTVDSHVHVWDADRVPYPWLAYAPRLARRYDLSDVEAEQRSFGVRQLVLVQAADSVNDTEHMLKVARRFRQVAGVVAWVPLLDVGRAESILEQWEGEPIVGVRHLIHRDPDQNLLADRRIDDVLQLLSERSMSFDVCAETEHLLSLVPDLAERHPKLTLVVDHLAKPPIARQGWDPWARLLGAVADAPNVVVKLSGLNTAAAAGASSPDYQPYVDHALEGFGPNRTMYGSDWPFALLAAESYTQIANDLLECLTGLEPAARQAVLAHTARRVYRLPHPSASA
jgi:L-fuconolactonase